MMGNNTRCYSLIQARRMIMITKALRLRALQLTAVLAILVVAVMTLNHASTQRDRSLATAIENSLKDLD